MASAWDHVRSIGSVLSIIGVGAGLALYFSDFKTRLEKAEARVLVVEGQIAVLNNQIRTLVSTPLDKQQPIPPTPNAVPQEATAPRNPLIEACVELLRHAGDKSYNSFDVSLYLQDYGCNPLLKQAGKTK
jgi:hypothetical protein